MARTIGVYGSSAPQPGEPAYRQAYALGEALGRLGFDVINGGHEGTMAAVSQGVKTCGRLVTGVTCAPVRDGRGAQPNVYLDYLVDTPSLLTRIEVLMRRASGFVFLPGGTGTLAEFALIWEHVNKGFIDARPLVCLGDFWLPVIRRVTEHQGGADRVIHIAADPAAAAGWLDAHAQELPAGEAYFLGAGVVVKRPQRNPPAAADDQQNGPPGNANAGFPAHQEGTAQ